MALTATFRADFQQFEASLQKASVQTTAFDRATKTALTGLRREIESFKGENLAIQAARMVEAVNQIGGVSKLTDAELKKLQATLDQTAEKAKRLGDAVPPAIAKMRAEIEKLPKHTTIAGAAFSDLGGALQKLGPLLPIASVAGGATALIGMAKSALDAAGKIEDLSSKTGLAMGTIQRMQFVANQTGTSIDAFTNAAFKLGVNVSEGSKKARDAVSELGLSYEALKAQSPDQQFEAVVGALEQVESQTERNRIGVSLFGRQFSEIAAAVNEGYSDMADQAEVSSDVQIKALAKLGDEITKLKDNLKAGVVSVFGEISRTLNLIEEGSDSLSNTQKMWLALTTGGFGYLKALQDIGVELEGIRQKSDRLKVPAAFTAMAGGPGAGPGMSPEEMAAAEKALTQATERQITTREKATKAAVDAGRAERQLWNEIGLAQQKYAADALAEQDKLTKQVAKLHSDMANEAGLAWMELDKAMMTPLASKSLARMWEPLKDAVKPNSMIVQTMGGNIMAGLGDVFKNQFGPTIMAAVTGGGNVLSSIGSMVGQSLGGSIVKSFSDSFSKSGIGSVLSSILPGVGALLGPAIGFIGGLFTDKNAAEVKKWNAEIDKVRETLIDTHGSLDQLEKKAGAVGLSFKEEWGHQGEEGLKRFNAFIKEFDLRIENMGESVSALFAELKTAGMGVPETLKPIIQHLIDIGVLGDDVAETFKELSEGPGLKDMEEAAGALGVRLSSLGPAFDAKKLSADANEFLKNLTILERGGADMGGVLSDAAQGASDLVNEAIRLGSELPERLRKYIEELAKSGKLVDENGDALTDLSRLNWAEPMSRSVDRMIDKFTELTNVIINQLVPALGSIAVPNVNLPSVPAAPMPMASGGDYLVRRPTLFLAGENGVERATFTPGGGSGAATPVHVTVEADGRGLVDFVVEHVGNRLSVRGGR
jgi:hypothetical protein